VPGDLLDADGEHLCHGFRSGAVGLS
jgi:hypothetical protein